MKSVSAIFLALVCFCFSNAQFHTDSLHRLPEVEKVASSASAVKRITYSPITPSRNLNEVLKENTGIFIRNYGYGQLSSVSFRGMSAAQTDVLWNGVKLNSPALGQADISLFTFGMLDILHARGVAQNGNVGGELDLVNDNSFDSTLSAKAYLTYGSFNTFRSYGNLQFASKKLFGATRVSYMSSDNDYTFMNTNKPGNPREKLTNSKIQLLNFMQQFGVKINEYNSLRFNLWLSDAQRLIPPVMSKTESRETQSDYSLRSMVTWNGVFDSLKAEFTSGFFHDVIEYANPDIFLDARSTMQAFRNNLKLSYAVSKNISIPVEVGYDFERAVVPSYVNSKYRHIGKLSAGVKYQPLKGISVQLNFREHIFDKNFSPFSPSVSVNYHNSFGSNYLTVSAIAARNFRFPTLNDLYWSPGGNSNLKTEKNWEGEAGVRYDYSMYFSFRVYGFCKYVTDWIQWLNNGSYWEPQNVKRVLSRGAEITATAIYYTRDFDFDARLSYTYTRATNLDALNPYDRSKGKQLIYVPLHVASARLKLAYRKFFISAVNTYNDAVFITTDNSQSLKGYYLLDMEAGKDFDIKNYEVGFSFRVNNVTDKQYQNVAQRPMPGRNFEGTIRFKFNS